MNKYAEPITRYKLAIVNAPNNEDTISVSVGNKVMELRFMEITSRPDDVKITEDLKQTRLTILNSIKVMFSDNLHKFEIEKDGISFEQILNTEGDVDVRATMGLWSKEEICE